MIWLTRSQAASRAMYQTVDTFADLPDPANHSGDVWLVKLATGVIFINYRRAGLYLCNGLEWGRMGQIVAAGAGSPTPGYLLSNPPVGKCVVTNVYADPVTKKFGYDFEDQPVE